MSGALDGAIICSAPSLFTVLCGEKPIKVDSGVGFGLNTADKSEAVAAYIRAENGDIILSAPNGRVRMQARDIDIISSGNGDTTGFVNVRANAAVDVKVLQLQCKQQIPSPLVPIVMLILMLREVSSNLVVI